MTYDVFISYRHLDQPWVECLARNLAQVGYRVFLDVWELVPGNPWIDELDDALRATGRGILVATPEAIESGWVRMEYRSMLIRQADDPAFRFVPIVAGAIPEFPFLRTVQCVDFRDPSPEAYRRAFYRLLCGLDNRRPGPDAELSVEPEIPEPLRPSLEMPIAGEEGFLERIFSILANHPILLLLAQADCGQGELIEALLVQARKRYGDANTLHITPPFSEDAELADYFARLGRQCGFADEIRNPVHWDNALDRRLAEQKGLLFLLVSGFENGSESGRRELAGVLRSLGERHAHRLRVALCGGEKLAELKYASGELSLLNLAEDLSWPEPTADDVMAWQRRTFPGPELDRPAAEAILAACGGHPRLVRHCLQYRQQQAPQRDTPLTQDDCLRVLRGYNLPPQLFLPYRREPEKGEKVCAWLTREDEMGEVELWPDDPLLRSLYWNNLLIERDGRWRWRCEALREAGRRILKCPA